MKRKSHSSTNDGLHPYVKRSFEGTEQTKEAMKNVSTKKNSKPLMTDEQWKVYCQARRSGISFTYNVKVNRYTVK